ncbi:hypothetical protein BRPE64_ACDS22650 [Caballeronia insecticola]|uniref:Uncharacterized protein n=1 Tax=Caballeronia insecticola TaxID=758793 RepID=R4WIC1_9BURK|nr:hypothetical protein BRPE64_ACDS22650 [Caballeronia insecticola]
MGIFAVTGTAATGAMAQTSSGNSSAAMGNDTAGTSDSSGTMKHKKPRKHTAQPSSGKKTPDTETGNNASGESGQSK